MRFIDELNLKDKRVLLRADLNVPLENGEITDDYRIRATLPSINYALKEKAKLILVSHLGRPTAKDPAQSLRPVAQRLSELLKLPVAFVQDCIGEEVLIAVNKLRSGEVLLLENVRFHKEEEENDPEFARSLGALCEVYINDAFATAHRKHASTSGICQFVPERAGGFTLKDELTYFERALKNPKRPLVVIFGGAKVSTKMRAIRFAGAKADKIIIGGAMANTFFAARGLSIGKSLFEPSEIDQAREAEKALKDSGVEVYLPIDVVVSEALKGGGSCSVVAVDRIPADMMALDIGSKTSELFDSVIDGAGTVIWNGPMGAFEIEEFSAGTYRLVDSITSSGAVSLVGGGDTDLALHRRGAFERVSYVSTAGGAFLKLLEGGKLPAVAALEGA